MAKQLATERHTSVANPLLKFDGLSEIGVMVCHSVRHAKTSFIANKLFMTKNLKKK